MDAGDLFALSLPGLMVLSYGLRFLVRHDALAASLVRMTADRADRRPSRHVDVRPEMGLLGTRLNVTVGGLHPRVWIRRRSGIEPAQPGLNHVEISLGSAAIDARYVLGGDELALRVLLNERGRRRLMELDRARGLSLEQGALTYSLTTSGDDLHEVRALFDEAEEVWEEFRVKAHEPERVIIAFREEPVPALRARALLAVLRLGDAELRACADRLLADGDPAEQAVAALCSGDRARVDACSREGLHTLAEHEPETVGDALARAGAEGPLMDLLRSEGAAIRVAAARALGVVGTITAVAALMEVGEQRLAGRELRGVAREAVAQIQARLGDADAGRLSVLDPDGAGELSLLEQGGGLSVAERGHLSTPEREG